MAIIIDSDDRDSINKILGDLALEVITPSNPNGNITPAAVQIMLSMRAFLMKDGVVARTPRETAKLVYLASHIEDIQDAEPNQLKYWVDRLIKDIISHGRQYAVNSMVGLDVAFIAVYYALRKAACAKFFSMLSWSVVNNNGDNVLTLGALQFGDRINGGPNYLLEGLLVGLVMYPQIPYQVALGDAILIPTQDSSLQLKLEKSGGRQYAIKVPGTNFTGHYLEDTVSGSRVIELWGGIRPYLTPTPAPREGYLLFDDTSFLQGLLSITVLVGVIQPWLSLDINMGNDNWVPANIVPS